MNLMPLATWMSRHERVIMRRAQFVGFLLLAVAALPAGWRLLGPGQGSGLRRPVLPRSRGVPGRPGSGGDLRAELRLYPLRRQSASPHVERRFRRRLLRSLLLAPIVRVASGLERRVPVHGRAVGRAVDADGNPHVSTGAYETEFLPDFQDVRDRIYTSFEGERNGARYSSSETRPQPTTTAMRAESATFGISTRISATGRMTTKTVPSTRTSRPSPSRCSPLSTLTTVRYRPSSQRACPAQSARPAAELLVVLGRCREHGRHRLQDLERRWPVAA